MRETLAPRRRAPFGRASALVAAITFVFLAAFPALAQTPASNPTTDAAQRPADLLGAVGIGVSDLERSLDFYTRVLGMKKTRTYELATMDEIVVSFEGRPSIVLMHWTDGSPRNYRDNPVKLVFYVADPVAIANRIRAEGLAILREPTPVPTLDNAIVGLAKDPDGYVIELLQAPPPQRR
jgi:lactoylglutathione lyase